MATVIIVEQVAPVVRLMSWFLVEAGFEVTRALPGPEATARVVELQPPVVVFNSGFPIDQRRESIAEWRTLSPYTRVLDVFESERRPDRPDVGADASLQMPFDADTLVDLVKDLADQAGARP